MVSRVLKINVFLVFFLFIGLSTSNDDDIDFKDMSLDSITRSEDTQRDDFGRAIATFDSTIAVGAPQRVKFNTVSGAVYIFERNFEANRWENMHKIEQVDALNLGTALALNGDWLAVTGQSFKYGAHIVYVYHKLNNIWVLSQVISGGKSDPKSFFGCDLKIKGNIMLIGAYGENYNAGAAYFYELVDSKWVLIQRVAPETYPESYFGNNVALDNDIALISSWGTTVNDMAKAGSVHVFSRNNDGSWKETNTLVSPEAFYFQRFGRKCLDIKNNTAMVCASNSNINNYTEAGAVFVYIYESGAWNPSQRLSPCDSACYDNFHFGVSLSLSRDLVIIGSELNVHNRGGVFAYKKNSEDEWERIYHLTAKGLDVTDEFYHVSLNDYGLAVVGTPNEFSRGSIYSLFFRCLGSFGMNCDIPCNKQCNNGSCEGGLLGTGVCVCDEMFMGEYCDILKPLPPVEEHHPQIFEEEEVNVPPPEIFEEPQESNKIIEPSPQIVINLPPEIHSPNEPQPESMNMTVSLNPLDDTLPTEESQHFPYNMTDEPYELEPHEYHPPEGMTTRNIVIIAVALLFVVVMFVTFMGIYFTPCKDVLFGKPTITGYVKPTTEEAPKIEEDNDIKM